MLSGLRVICGNAQDSLSCMQGLAQEAELDQGVFVRAEKPLREDSLYDLASLTKLFTLIAVVQLIVAGQLRPEDDFGVLDRRFPGLRGCSIHEILSYQAVLRTPERIDAQPDREGALRQVFATARASGPEPGKLYSDMNALVLKYLVESLSGQAFYDYLAQHVLGPCGMADTFSQVPEARLKDCLNYNYEHRLIRGEAILLTGSTPGTPHDPKARLLRDDGRDLPGHAGLFSSAQDMLRLAQALLRGELIPREWLMRLGLNRTGRMGGKGGYRQYLGYLCFAKSMDQRLSELPSWMGTRAFGLSGYTGNHFAMDPELGVFDIFLGNRCHMRLSSIEPQEDAAQYPLSPEGAGILPWPDGRRVQSSFHYQYLKDRLLHQPVQLALGERGMLKTKE